MNSSALAIDYSTYVDRLGEATMLAAARMAGGVKALARHANTNERTIENIIQKRSGANGFTLLKLMTVPEIQTEVRRLVGMEADLDPELEQYMSQMIGRYQRMKAAQ